MGCAPSKRVKKAGKGALQKGSEAEHEIIQGSVQNPPNLCSHPQDVRRPVVPVAESENDNNLIALSKLDDQTVLEQNNPINLPYLDRATEVGHGNDICCKSLTNMDLNGETVLNGGVGDSRILILHFNDVYNIEPREKEPVGGAARFASKIATFKSRNPLILFSGDALNPSMSKSHNIANKSIILIEFWQLLTRFYMILSVQAPY